MLILILCWSRVWAKQINDAVYHNIEFVSWRVISMVIAIICMLSVNADNSHSFKR